MNEHLKHAPCGFVSLTSQGIITFVNETFLKMGDYQLSEIQNQHIESMMSMANKLIFHSYFYPFIQLYGHVNELYLTIKSSTGKDIPVLINGVRVDRDGEEVFDCVFVEMYKRISYEKEIRTAKKQMEEAYRGQNEALEKLEQMHEELELKQHELMKLNEQLAEQANTDGLTKLYNRRYFMERLREQIHSFHEYKTPFSVLLVDVDYFKKINDTMGHLYGDKVLAELATIMRISSDDCSILGRYGGEEFIILLPGAQMKEAKDSGVNASVLNGGLDD